MTEKFIQKKDPVAVRQEFLNRQRAGVEMEEKIAGQILTSSKERAKRATAPGPYDLSGFIPAKAADGRKEREDRGDAIVVEKTEVISGVIAATVSTNRIMPMHTGNGTWDVLACHFAVIDGGFSGFRLPPVGIKLGQYASGVMNAEFDETEFNLYPPKQNIFDVKNHQSYAIQGLARCNQSGLSSLMSASNSKVDVLPLRWAGPWDPGEIYLMNVALDDHIIPDVGVLSHTPTEGGISMQVPPVETVESSSGHALVDITFLSINGGKWQAFPTRLR